MANNLEVSITANIADFQEKLRQAQQNLRDATTAMQGYAAQVQASGGTNTYAVGQYKEASNAVAEYTLDIANAKAGIAAAIPKMAEFSGSTSVATRELLVLGREAARGNFSRMAGSLSVLAQQGFGVQPAMMAAAAGVAVLVGGLGYLIEKAEATSIALAKISLGAAFQGGLSLTTQQIKGFEDELAKIPGMTEDDAQKIIAAFSTMKTTSIPEIQALGLSVKDYATLSGQSLEQATADLKKAFSDPLKNVVEFVTQFQGATQAQKDQAEAAQRSGDANSAAALMVQMLRDAMRDEGRALDELAVKQAFDLFHLNSASEAELRVAARRRAATERISEEAAALEILTEARNKANATAEGAAGAMGNIGTPANAAMLAGIADASKLDPTISKARELNATIQRLTALLPEATAEAQRLGDSGHLDILVAGLAKARTELAELNLGPIVDKARADIANLQSTWSGSQAGMLAAERAIWAGVAQQTAVGTSQHLQAIQEMGRLDVQLRRQSSTDVNKLGQEAVSAAHEQIAEIQANDTLSRQQQLAAARDVWVQLLAGSKLNASQRVEAEREYNLSVAALNRQATADAKAISADQTKTDIQIRKDELAAQKDGLDAQVSARQITAAQKLAIEKNLTAEIAGLDIQDLQNEQAGLDQQSVEYAKLADQIRLIKSRLNLDLANLDKQAATQSVKDATEQALAWRDAFQEAGQASDNFVRDVFTGQHTLVQSLQQLTSQWLQNEIAADVKYYTTRMLYSALGMADEVKNLHGGLLATILTEQGKTQATATGTAQRKALDSTADTSFLGRIAQQLAHWLGFETAKTTETATETTARTTIEATAATTSIATATATAAATKAADAAMNAGKITADSALVFAGVFANLAPVLGPAAAGPAAAAQAEVLGQLSLAAFAVGAWEIPHDMAAIVHQGETIMPKSFAEGFRDNAGNGAGGGDIYNVAPTFAVTAMDARSVLNLFNNQTVLRQIARNVSRYLGDNISRRPSYGG